MKNALRLRRLLFLLILLMVLLIVRLQNKGAAQEHQDAHSSFQTPLTQELLDPTAFAVWAEGKEQTEGLPREGARHLIWTQNSGVEWDGLLFGNAKSPGPRHLRIGFKTPVAFQTLLVRAGGQVSVLRPDATYPGRLNNEADWIPAQRLSQEQISHTEPESEEFALWILPPGTSSRAIRFSHTPHPTDTRYGGWLGGVILLNGRYANLAPQAKALTVSNPDQAGRLNDGSANGTWQAWENVSREAVKSGEHTQPVSPAQPEYITLIWPKPVMLQGLCSLWTGFSAAEAQSYVGGGDPRSARETDWRTVQSFSGLTNQYPRALGPNWLDFGKTVTTRAIRLKITQPTQESHPHLNGNTEGGRRIWLGELLALSPLEARPLSTVLLPKPESIAQHPPLPVRFTLAQPGYVTLVIDDAAGRRVRNLLSDTWFPAGANVAWWDGQDDLARDTEAARHGIYHVPGRFVAPGTYRVRGLFHKAIDLRYEFSPYNGGSPAWETEDHTGAWLANHTPPSSALFVPSERAPGGKPLIFLGSYVSEGGHGLAWVDLDGKKQGGVGWVGGNWTGAPYLAYDAGSHPDSDVYAYAGSAWEGELRLTALTHSGDKPVIKYTFPGGKAASEITGLAVRDGLLVCSLPKEKRLLFVDAKSGRLLEGLKLEDARGLAFDAQGRLLALAGHSLIRCPALPPSKTEGEAALLRALLIPEPLITGLEDPQQITQDSKGNLYISDRGKSHQIKVYTPNGEGLGSIGKPGVPAAGPYDPLHLNNPNGLTIDSQDHLWVAETDFRPKRVSVWTLTGQLIHAFYGPSEYGGGGTLDPENKSRFYYRGMEFQLDWQTGKDTLVRVISRPSAEDQPLPSGFGADGAPELPLTFQGRRYFSNCYNSNPTNGASIALLWRMENDIAIPCAALGRANDWDLLKSEAFQSRWPAGVDLKGDGSRNQTLFIWSDRNGDGKVQPDEVTFQKASVGGITLMPDLSYVAARVDEKAMRFAPLRFTEKGVPFYDLTRGEILVNRAQGPVSSGGDQAMITQEGWTILTNAPYPFAPESVGGAKNGAPLWSYPSLWHGLHASHESPAPDHSGELIGTTRLLGAPFVPKGSQVGSLWAINGNMGAIYLFTAEGLFVSQLFQDVRQGRSWSMPVAERGMRLNDLTLHDENFWPTITRTSDGNVYLVDGGRTSLVRIDGLDSLRRLPETSLTLTAADLKRAQAFDIESEALRQKSEAPAVLNISTLKTAPTIDGNLDEWKQAEWIRIDKRGVNAWFDSNSKPYNVTAALAVAGDRLYVAYRTGDKELLRNSGEIPNAPFKTGGALDLMLGTDPKADPKRSAPVPGDLRLLVTLVKGKPYALLYRAVVPGVREPVAFSSPWRTITIDRVENVSDQIQLAGADGNYEFSVPLQLLGLKPAAGLTLKGDIGLLRGNGFQTLQRVYWSNKATGITADVPSEAMLAPLLWGSWIFSTP